MGQIIYPPQKNYAAPPVPTAGEKTSGTSGNAIRSFSVDDVQSLVTIAYNAIVNGAPDALNQLNELAAALGNDANFSTTVLNGLANRLRVDAPQTLSNASIVRAFSNLGITLGNNGYVLTDNGAGVPPSFKPPASSGGSSGGGSLLASWML